MSFKKIFAVVMASAVACGAFAAHAVTLDVAEGADELAVAEEAVLAADATVREVTDVAGLTPAIATDGEIKLGANIVLNEPLIIPEGKNITLDLNGYTITCSGEACFCISSHGPSSVGVLTVKDTSTEGNGKIIGMMAVSGTLNVESGTITSAGYGSGENYIPATIMLSPDSWANYPELNVTGGKIEFTANPAAYSDYVEAGVFAAIIGSNTNGRGGVIKFSDDAVVESTGGCVAMAARIYDHGDVTVNGGTFTGGENVELFTEIGGSQFTEAPFVIYGGTFSADIPDEYLADGFVTEKNEDGTFGVINTNVAKVGDNYYATLQEAINAATDGAEIVVLADLTGDVTIKQAKDVNITIDGNGKSFAGTITIDGANRSTGAETLTIKNVKFIAEGEWQASIETVKSTLAHNITVDGCTFTGKDKKQYGIILRNAYNIIVKNTTGTKLYDLVYGNRAVTGFTAENVTVTESTNGIWLSYVNSTAAFNNLNVDVSSVGVGLLNNAKGSATIENSTIKAEAPAYLGQNGTITNALTLTVNGTNNFTGTGENGAWLEVDGTDAKFNVIVNDSSLDGNKISGVVAFNGDAYYNTVAQAVSEAETGDTVTLISDTASNVADEATIDNKEITIDLNGKTLYGAIKPSTGDITVKNGSIVNKNAEVSGIEVNEGKLTLTNVNIESARHAVRIDGDVTAVIDGGTYKVGGTIGCTQYAVNVSGADDVTIKDGTFIGPKGTVSDSGSAIKVKTGAAVTIEDGKFTGGKNSTLSVEGTLTVKGGLFDQDPTAYVAEGLTAAKYAEGNAYAYKVVSADIYGNTTIKVEFVKADVDGANKDNLEGEDIYNINLVADSDKVINRLNSADLTFVLTTTEGKVAYEIIDIADDHIAVNPVDNSKDRYEFHFETKTDVANDTANTITIAQVKFKGYGKFTFAVDTGANDTNTVHATKALDNIVDTFIPGGATGKGTLDLDDSTTGEVTIVVPVRTLTVNVAFPNAVVDNDVLYQDMKVEITGNIDGVNKTVTYKLGTDEVAMVNGGYVVTEDKLVLNETYNVVVTGAGYRTARYTVTMTEAKTVNFWNNVKDNDTVVEEGKYSEKKNFLAGDIVGDNQINIYDLSAVVSYFATEITDEADYDKYVKYDLNRDGVIDSKDVAYVLVSWGE